MAKSSVLVTGGAGLIGSHLCEELMKSNYQITCADNFITGNHKNIEHLLSNPNFRLIEPDVSQPVGNYLRPEDTFNYIFHLASPASPKGYQENPIATYQVNAFGTHYLAEFAQKIQARFLFASTSEVYGDPLVHPQPETYWGNVNPNGLRACYDESKRFGEMVCLTYHRLFNLDTRIVRIFNTFGPRNDPGDGRVVPNFIIQALKNEPLAIYGDGSQTRSFCYVSDLVAGITKTMFTDNLAGEVINLGNPAEFTILDFANLVKKLTNSHSEIIFKPLPEDDPKQRRPDITKANRLLNWEPMTSIEDGLVKTIEYYKKSYKLQATSNSY
jgi:UDP-glucuronate decarboxylase